MPAALAAITMGLATACAGPTFIVQQYTGAQRPPDTIATLRVNGNDPVRLVTLDDEDVRAPLDVDSRLHIELLPGRHTVTVQPVNAPSERSAPLAFDAEAGKFYRVVLTGAEPSVVEVDKSSDAPRARSAPASQP